MNNSDRVLSVQDRRSNVPLVSQRYRSSIRSRLFGIYLSSKRKRWRHRGAIHPGSIRPNDSGVASARGDGAGSPFEAFLITITVGISSYDRRFDRGVHMDVRQPFLSRFAESAQPMSAPGRLVL